MKFLRTSQEDAFEILNSSKNVFLTGAPGSGKSFTIKKFVAHCKSKDINVAVTALTGCAAFLIGGQTVHSWSGIGTGELPPLSLVEKVKKSKKIKNWYRTKILIIDEISMMSSELFHKLNKIGQIIRKNDKPFGGIQLITVGDFHQLKPVKGEYVFTDTLFEEITEYGIYLNKIYRQKEKKYLRLLDQLREGDLDETSEKYIKKIMKKKVNKEDDIQPTKLMSLNKQVDEINKKRLEAINEKEYIFTASDIKYDVYNDGKKYSFKMQQEEMETMITKYTNSNYNVKLKKGAQVMLLKNYDAEVGLVNGAIGVITQINEFKGIPNTVMVKFNRTRDNKIKDDNNENEASLLYELQRDKFEVHNDDFSFTFNQVPLRCAWATSIHKSQGQSISCCEVDIGRSIFTEGQMYVAMTRIIDPFPKEKEHNKGLYISDFSRKALRVNRDVVEFYKKFDDNYVNEKKNDLKVNEKINKKQVDDDFSD